MIDKLKPGSKASIRRQEVWKHNSLRGMAAMMKANANTIATSTTATYNAKRLAAQIGNLSIDLMLALEKRNDQ